MVKINNQLIQVATMTDLQHNHVHNINKNRRSSQEHRRQDKSNENKKVLHSLKQQISNIRQGMNIIMRAKSQENNKIMQKIKSQSKNIVSNKNSKIDSQDLHNQPKQLKKNIVVSNKSSKIDPQDLHNQPKQLKKRILYLQKENLRLLNELQQVKIIKNSQISALTYRKKQLENEKHAIKMQTIKISAQLQKYKIKTSSYLASNRKQNKPVQQPKISEIPIFDPSQNQLNPELKPNTQTIQIKNPNPQIKVNIDLLIRQNYTMKNILQKLQHEISLISIKNLIYEKAIELSNKQIIDLKIKALENKLKLKKKAN